MTMPASLLGLPEGLEITSQTLDLDFFKEIHALAAERAHTTTAVSNEDHLV